MSKNSWWLLIILAIFAFGLYFILPPNSERLGRNGFKLGLDLKGGTQLVYQADLSKKDPSQSDSTVMATVKQKIEKRVNSFGVAEPLIQVGGNNQILVQLPGVKDINQAKQLIGATAELKFEKLSPDSLDASGNLTWTDSSGQKQTQPYSSVGFETLKTLTIAGQVKWVDATAVGSSGQTEALTGKYLKPNAQVVLNQQNTQPEVAFEWNSEGAVLSQQITRELLQKPMGIFLDQELLSAPVVQAVITDKGVIQGISLEEGKTLSAQLNSGSLDVPLSIIEQQDVDATAGADSLRRSLFAGAIGLALVLLYMIVSYQLPGLLAGLALLIYGAILLSIFKAIPVTLSLPGIAGVIISIGMAVDANVLVFERLKEEVRTGISYSSAVEKGFNRAWPSIRDSNISTFITCVILYWFGSTFGASMVQGFALTLFIGVAVSMFTALTATRTFIRVFIGTRLARPPRTRQTQAGGQAETKGVTPTA